MSILSDFLTLIDPLLGGRAYRNVAPDSAQPPYAVFFRVAGIEGLTLDENGGTGNETSTRIQLDIYGSAADVDATAAAVKAALKTWAVVNVVLLEQDNYEKEVKLHRTTLDISAWHL